MFKDSQLRASCCFSFVCVAGTHVNETHVTRFGCAKPKNYYDATRCEPSSSTSLSTFCTLCFGGFDTLMCKAYPIRRQWTSHILPSCFDQPVGMMVIASGVSLMISLLPSTRSKSYQVLSFLLIPLTRNQGDLRLQRASLSISWSKTASEHAVSTQTQIAAEILDTCLMCGNTSLENVSESVNHRFECITHIQTGSSDAREPKPSLGTSIYQYQRLGPTEFGALRIKPGLFIDPIQCKIYHSDITHSP